MVSISDTMYGKAYPSLVKFVRNDLPAVVNKPRVYNAFIKYAEYGWTLGRTAFWPTADPIIHVEALNTHSAPNEYIFAKFKVVTPRYIYIDTDWAKRFERDVLVPVMRNNAKRLMEACILHEMCHRGDWDDGKPQELEAGEEFEKAAYGALQGSYWIGPI
jgi:hypothetical protein